MITLYGASTPNVQKVAILLAELGIAWTPRPLDLEKKEQLENWFLKLSPNNRVPCLVDDATGVNVWESGAILIYLAETYDSEGHFLPRQGQARYEALQGVFFQAANIGPSLGRLSAQLMADDQARIPAMRDLFYIECVRLMKVLDRMLADGREYLAGTYSIADIMHYPWLKAALDLGFNALTEQHAIVDWLNRTGEREAVKAGMIAFS